MAAMMPAPRAEVVTRPACPWARPPPHQFIPVQTPDLRGLVTGDSDFSQAQGSSSSVILMPAECAIRWGVRCSDAPARPGL